MERTPSDNGNISIEEPVSGNSLKVLLRKVGDSGGSLRSGNSSAEEEDLFTDFGSNVGSSLLLEEFVV